jgi:tetratricopeptide (TPR) repeat protein
MKKIIINISLTFVFITSCTNDFINILPTSTVSVDILYKSDKDFQDALTAAYNMLQTQYQDFYVFGDIRGDDSWEQIYKNNSPSYSDLFTTTSSDGLMNTTWQRYYRTIFRINTILEKIEGFDESAIPTKNRYIAEARFIRALSYFDLVRIFGAVPAVTKTLSIEESYAIPREPIENIFSTIIIPDFTMAEGALPSGYSGSDIGRPTSGAAKAMLGRVYLTIKDFTNAESKLEEVTRMGYSLLADYNELFDYNKTEHHSEYIFDIEYESGIGEGSRFTTAFFPNFAEMNTYYDIVGAGEEHNNPTPELVDLFDADDTRKEVTVGIPGGFYDDDDVFHALPTSTNQTYTKKYFASSPVRADGKANWKVIRYGDVILMLAEALNENGKTAQAIPYLNQIRTRAGVSVYPTTMSQSQTRQAIVKERRLELSFEGVRWFDLVRTGEAYNIMKDYGMASYMTVFPIPLSQIQLSNDPAIFPQNPGYD